ncbi:MAG: RagB/SusD family nutrient uptake outer membrane protein [Gemmatimonadetes bacterium]|nr:RagB/SusD family nutrient uptake outer membrane protein [Gemmatimonadota bacterium]
MTTTTDIRKRSGRAALRLGFAFVGAMALAACGNLDIVNTNAPTVEELTKDPSSDVLSRAATGIFSQAFNDVGTEIQFYALYGREGYNLLGNDPRETGEQIRGPQDPTGRNSGIWTGQYSAIRTINTYLKALESTSALNASEVNAATGFANTMKAWHIVELAIRTGALGIPLDVDRPINADPAPFVSFSDALQAASDLLDSAYGDLQSGGGAFPFRMAPGYSGFDTPPTFALFNRALAAKVQVWRATFLSCTACWTQAKTALDASFVTDGNLPSSLSIGVFFGYSDASGEPTNPVSEPTSSNHLWVHPSIVSGAQLRANGEPDLRLTEKVMDVGRTRDLNDLSSSYKPILFNNKSDPTQADLGAPIPWITNEELLLLRAEVRWNTSDKSGAIGDLDLIREYSGGLEPTTLTAASPDADFITELLYNRLYSLLWTQGTRWIDARRYNRLDQLPVDRPGDSVFDNMIVPANECAARRLAAPCSPLGT